MSNPQRELSNEILKIIFFYLPRYRNSKRTLGQCALTCRGWRLVAQSLIFHSLTLKNENDIEDINSMKLHNYMIEQWTRRLYIDFIVSEPSTFIAINKLLPRIEELYFNLICHYKNDVRQRIDLAYFFLYELLAEDNKFNNLRILPIPGTIKQYELYVECLYVIRNRITDIEINDDFNENRLLYANLCNNLHLFPHLKSVRASVHGNKSLDVIGYCESLLNKKNLSSVFLQKLTIGIRNSLYVNSSALLEQDDIFPASNIKSVVISIDYPGVYRHLEALNINLMIYIIKKFPNLESLKLEGNYHWKVIAFKDITRVPRLENEDLKRIKQSPSVICQFLNYIFKIPNCYLEGLIISNEYTVQVIQELFTSSSKGTKNLKPTIPNHLYMKKATYYFDHHEDSIVEASFIILDVKTTPEYRKIYICISEPNDIAFRTQESALVEQIGKYFDAVYLDPI